MASPPQSAPNPQVGYLRLLTHNPSYRSLWLGDVVSLFGDWFNLIASAALVSKLSDSGLAVGGLFVVRMLAPFLISPLAGVAADRFDRKKLLIASDLLRAIVVLGFLLVRRPDQVWLLYTLTAIQLALSGFFFPARNALLPNIVQRAELGSANALSSTTWSVMFAFGAALGGIVAGEWGIYPAFVIDSLTFLVSAFFISRVTYLHLPDLGHAEITVRHALSQYLEGLRYLRTNLDILAISLNKAALSLTINGIFQVIQVAIAERIFVMGEGGGTSLGLMLAVAGVGTGIGPIFARKFTGDRETSLRRTIALAYLIAALGLGLVIPLSSFPLVLLGTFLRAFGGGITWVFSTQLLLQLTPDYVRGRVFSTEFAFFTLATALSSAFAGFALDSFGFSLSQLLIASTLFTFIPFSLWLTWTVLHHSQPSAPPA